MERYSVLILTDHSNHSSENSLYDLAKTMLKHPLTKKIDIASRANRENEFFFKSEKNSSLFVSEVTNQFKYSDSGEQLSKHLKLSNQNEYDLIWLRLPPPLGISFLDFIEATFSTQIVINNPKGINLTGSKEFLINFQAYCPPLKICQTKKDITEFKNKFPIVLKPFRAYGGKGLVKIAGEEVWMGREKLMFEDFINQLKPSDLPLLGVKYLSNVSKGDKRIIVVNGKILGASLRLPPENSWICNVSMGGSSNLSEVDEDERLIVEAIDPVLSEMGIVMYGVDTLVGDDGKRLLSEINTTSIGGLPQIGKSLNLPVVEEAIDLIWSYFLKNRRNEETVE